MNYVVVSDVHGRYEQLGHCYDLFKNVPDVQFVSNGDLVDGTESSNVLKSVQLVLDIGAICIMGNHEWMLAGSMYSNDDSSRQDYAKAILSGGNQSATFRSYGVTAPSIYNRVDWPMAAADLKQSIGQHGHTKYFDSLIAYFEADNFMAIHGGLMDSYTWESQKISLNMVNTNIDYTDEPIQIFDPNFSLSASTSGHKDLDKVLVTGHNHLTASSLERKTDSGRRIRLASQDRPGVPLFAYCSWNQEVRAVS